MGGFYRNCPPQWSCFKSRHGLLAKRNVKVGYWLSLGQGEDFQ